RPCPAPGSGSAHHPPHSQDERSHTCP
ncbi:hypothetical protein BN1723_017872, partial [Verticillium longisporum]